MKLDSADSLFSHPDGAIIRPSRLRDDPVGIGIIIDYEREKQRREIGQRIGIIQDIGGFEPPPGPPSHRGDSGDDDNGVYTFDM